MMSMAKRSLAIKCNRLPLSFKFNIQNLPLSAIQGIGRARCHSAILGHSSQSRRFLSNKHGIQPVCLPRSRLCIGLRNPRIQAC
jgi:hypothetical protein